MPIGVGTPGRFTAALASHGPKLNFGQFCEGISNTLAAWMKSVRVSASALGYATEDRTATGTLPPRDETGPGAEVPSAIEGFARGDYCEIRGPTLGALISLRQLSSRWLIASIPAETPCSKRSVIDPVLLHLVPLS